MTNYLLVSEVSSCYLNIIFLNIWRAEIALKRASTYI